MVILIFNTSIRFITSLFKKARIGSFILFAFLLIHSAYAQKSDLKSAKPRFQYYGDSVHLKKILASLQSDSIQLIAQNNQICDLKISSLGSTPTLNISIYHIQYGLGESCRGVFLTTFFRNDVFIGHYKSDLALPKEIDGDNLIWQFEDGQLIFMALETKIPNEYSFGEFKRKFIRAKFK